MIRGRISPITLSDNPTLFAIASGGFLNGNRYGRPDMVPAVTTDFIFAAICEELGVFGGVAVVLLFMLLIYRGIKIILGVKTDLIRFWVLELL